VIKEFNLPALVTFAATYPESKDGVAWDTACQILESKGADVVGLNCIRGPETMFPLLEKIRAAVKVPLAAQPVPYKTTTQYPAFQFLKSEDGTGAFPVALEPHLLSRFAMADFAKCAENLGVNYIGICCGGAPHHVRAMAEALGRTVPASKYSPDMTQHGLLGKEAVVKTHEKKFLAQWR
jgi:betaine-homocysteine S-methyltransferase